MADKPKQEAFSSVPALITARAAQRLAEKYEDEGLAKAAQGLEERALDAIGNGQAAISPMN